VQLWATARETSTELASTVANAWQPKGEYAPFKSKQIHTGTCSAFRNDQSEIDRSAASTEVPTFTSGSATTAQQANAQPTEELLPGKW